MTDISREQFLRALDTYPIHDLYQQVDLLRLQAHDRNDLRHELLAHATGSNLLLALVLRETLHNLRALYARLPLESGTSTDWITPRRTA